LSSSAELTIQQIKKTTYQPAGIAFTKVGIIVGLVILIAAAWFGQLPIVILCSLLVGSVTLTWLWSRYSLIRVSCHRTLNQTRVFPGDQVEIQMRVQNRKLLPLPWLQIDDVVPLRFIPEALQPAGSGMGFHFLSKTISLLWYTGASWRQQLNCDKRGYYQLGPVTLTSGDIFGLYSRSAVIPLIDHIIVYPRIFSLAQLAIPSLYPLGETKSDRQIFEDPTRCIGVRDFSPGDSLRRIHWKASARYQQLKSRIYEPSTTLQVALFLAVDSFSGTVAHGEEEFELGISVAASLASHLTRQDSPVGLFVNTCQADSGKPVRIPAGTSTNHLVAMLEALAKITAQPSGPFQGFLAGERGGLPWGTTSIFIFAQPPDTLSADLISLRENGYKLMVIQIGDRAGKIEGVPWTNIGKTADIVAEGETG
jgi:uncharacterized protein (DUF58 family)